MSTGDGRRGQEERGEREIGASVIIQELSPPCVSNYQETRKREEEKHLREVIPQHSFVLIN